MISRQNIPQKYHLLFDYFQKLMTPEAFEIWLDNIANNNKNIVANPLKAKTNELDSIQQARELAQSYAPTNKLRQAIEALADALENKIGK